MGEEARSPWQPPAHPSPPPTPPSSDDSDSEPPPIIPPALAIITFFKFGRHHSHAEFAGTEISLPWYLTFTWMDALRDLTETTTKEAFLNLRENTKFSFARVFTDERGIRRIYRLGRTMCFAEERLDDHKSLQQSGFQIGDYLDVSIRYPRRLMIEERRAFTSRLFHH